MAISTLRVLVKRHSGLLQVRDAVRDAFDARLDADGAGPLRFRGRNPVAYRRTSRETRRGRIRNTTSLQLYKVINQ